MEDCGLVATARADEVSMPRLLDPTCRKWAHVLSPFCGLAPTITQHWSQ